jgi:hypothetical protein
VALVWRVMAPVDNRNRQAATPATPVLRTTHFIAAITMAKLTRSNPMSALAEGQPEFSAGTGRFTIGITGRDGTTYHVHLTAAEAQRFVDFVDDHT